MKISWTPQNRAPKQALQSHARKPASERGIITLLASLMMIMIVIPVVGLAIDAGVVFMIKAKLQASVDGAALASARGLSQALDLTTQQAAARDSAKRWYHANYPNGWMGVGTVADPTVTFPTAPARTIVVNVGGTVLAPTWFMRILGVNNVTINAIGESTRRFVNIMIVLDRSGSLYGSSSCDDVQAAATTFVNSFVNGQDRLGLVTFGTDYRVDFPPAYNFATASPSVSSMVSTLYCYGYTNAAAAYYAAYRQLVTLNDQGALNVILFFTDGQPNTITFGHAIDGSGTDNTLPAKALATPTALTPTTCGSYIPGTYCTGYDNKNPTLCKDAAGKLPGASGYSLSFTGVISPYAGIYQYLATSFPASQSVDAQQINLTGVSTGGCAFAAHFSDADTKYSDGSPSRAIAGPGFPSLFDVAYLPERDIWGNLTGAGYSGAAYAPVTRYPSGPYATKLRADSWYCTGSCVLGSSDVITNAGVNALDNAAQRARAESIVNNLNVYTYTIGLGTVAGGGADDELLRRIANDPDAGNFNSLQPVGEYINAPTGAQLNQAFSLIASSVLRLSK